MLKPLKKVLPTNTKLYLKSKLNNKKSDFIFNNSKRKIVIALAADYGNLGDVAITKAQQAFIENMYKGVQVVPIYLNSIEDIYSIKKQLNNDDIITLIGGGNMGDVYELIEEYRRSIIKLFPNNKIISFPQTIDFTNTSMGEKSLARSKKAYSSHKNLHIFSREPISFEIMKETFSKNSVYLVPDIVLSYKPTITGENSRDGIVLCLRDDGEKKISKQIQSDLIKNIENKYKDVSFYDTHIGDNNFNVKESDIYLNSIFDKFKSSELVITDRLHGMIFCAITGTPCLVLPNSNHKIYGTYKHWLRQYDFIKYIEKVDINNVMIIIDELLNKKAQNISPDLLNKYSELIDVLVKE
ncbi:polysaccharide pyruvyl transferase family protein [Terribacillus saccharophilus]|uniref:polysaccharide pyruvyl transferase family protein n=1 Tax=Terribacillus saccharophilus TaxID=361277 RepID=UPI003D278B79